MGSTSVAAQARLDREGTGWGLVLDGAVSDLALNDLGLYWPFPVADKTRDWITENLRDGTVTNATIRVDGWMDGFEPDTLQVDSLGRIAFENVTTHYFRPLPPVVGSNGAAIFDHDTFDISIESGGLRAVGRPSSVLSEHCAGSG